MKVLHITPAYVPAYRYGGPIFSVHAINKWLVKQKVEVTVYTTDAGQQQKGRREAAVDDVKVVYFPRNFPKKWYASRLMREEIKKNIKDFDLVHITSVFLSPSSYGARYARRDGKPYIISPRGLLMKAPLHLGWLKKKMYIELFERNNLAHAAALHFTSEEELKDYENAGLPKCESFIIPNGFDPEEYKGEKTAKSFREKIGAGEDKKIILSLGRISRKKGFEMLIPAFKDVLGEFPETVLAIVGGDDEGFRAKVEEMISAVGLTFGDGSESGKDVVFVGTLEGKEKQAAYEESDVFAMPSYGENLGMVSLETMYSGLPLVMTNVVGTASAVKDSGAGIVIDKDPSKVVEATEGDIKALTEGIKKILRNPRAKEEMGKKGKELVAREYSMDKIAERFRAEYEKIIERYKNEKIS